MKTKKKIILSVSLLTLTTIAIAVPVSLYYETKNYQSKTYLLQNNIQDVYCKSLDYNDFKQNTNTSAFDQYNNLQTCNINLMQLINGDKNINNGNYLLLIANQTNLEYQALAYENFITATYLKAYTNMYNSVLYNQLNSIGWNIPIFEYVQFPNFNNTTFKNSQLGIYEIYETYAPANTKSPTIEDNLYNHIITYAKKIWKQEANQNNTLLIGFKTGKANFWNQKTVMSFAGSNSSSSSNSNSNSSSSDPTDGGTQLPSNSLTTSTKQNAVKNYNTSLNEFLQTTYNNKTSTTSSSNNNSSASSSTNTNLYTNNYLYFFNKKYLKD
ncbi:MAG: hypothetical protein IIT78_00385 [Mycoplasmataceae bacterium]|nr:hypothetical protein [Mycoplasmataceae bacterium]